MIFVELAFYEGYERFIEIPEILYTRYGTALRALVRTKISELYLYGDESGSRGIIASARKRIFASPGREKRTVDRLLVIAQLGSVTFPHTQCRRTYYTSSIHPRWYRNCGPALIPRKWDKSTSLG